MRESLTIEEAKAHETSPLQLSGMTLVSPGYYKGETRVGFTVSWISSDECFKPARLQRYSYIGQSEAISQVLSWIGSFCKVIEMQTKTVYQPEFQENELITWHEYQGNKCVPVPGVVVRQSEESVLIRTRVAGSVKELIVRPEQLAHR